MSNSVAQSIRRRAPVHLDDCGLAAAADLIGDRWTLLILREAFYDVVRYDDMREDLSISRSVLTDRLQKLVSNGIMEKRSYQEEGDRERMAYGLTARGRELGVVMLAMLEWGNRDLPTKQRHEIVERKTGKVARVGVVNGDGAEISSTEIDIMARSDR